MPNFSPTICSQRIISPSLQETQVEVSLDAPDPESRIRAESKTARLGAGLLPVPAIVLSRDNPEKTGTYLSNPVNVSHAESRILFHSAKLSEAPLPLNDLPDTADAVASMSRRRMASNKPTLQRNISFPKRPYLLERLSSQSSQSTSVSPLSTASVALNYYFSKLAVSTPSTPADQIIHTPEYPTTPDRTVKKKPQRPTAFTIRQDSVPSPTALCAHPRTGFEAPFTSVNHGAVLSSSRGCLPRRLSSALRASEPTKATHCRSVVCSGCMKPDLPLESPAFI